MPSPSQPATLTVEDEGLDEARELGGDARFLLVVRSPGDPRVIEVGDGDAVTIGRAPDSTLVVDEGRVSRNHTRLERRGDILIVRDLGSRNGTKVNGAVVRDAERRVLGGDVITIGGCELVVATANPAAPQPTRDSTEPIEGVVVADVAMRSLFQLARKLARVQTTVLVLGETGVGKEIVAQQIHAWSPRASAPLVRLNCASVPESLLEGELFGHEKGAFTGAGQRKVGYLEAANLGTLFLDEIGETSLAMQAKLLTALENRTILRVGGTKEIPVDVRIIAATHRDLNARVAEGLFREDLFYRLSAFTLRVPPLRERRTEIAVLADLFVQRFATKMGSPPPKISPDALAVLTHHPWPGNVRELRNAIEHGVLLAEETGVIGPNQLPEHLRARPRTSEVVGNDSGAMRSRLADLEKKSIEEALAAESGNQTRAAKRLGISRSALLYKLDKHGLGGKGQ